ncbi:MULTISPECIES: MFS transporter [Microbacterium]|uniref:MFS transporter n=1 Tax=Microbacterium TaxID=33882 RepID=UPI00277E6007|nr:MULTISPECIES: MFS transporter [Microbacterium]MDQ1082452.1 putative MFS family arabinose efflux permease [Microbacterium sp. SORGH_AS_0344]MDQ1168776.1 putative MFS family arabinose efflux permease [Microbacterium proteolyticum]
MTTTAPVPTPVAGPSVLRYGGLIVVMLLSFLLVTAEFLPNGVLTEMAASLGVTPGQAGQTVTVTALAGLLFAPTIGLLLPRLDRRTLLVGAAAAAALSSLVVALAPSLPAILVARFLLGAAISSFWSMSITVAARLASPDRIGRALMFGSAGVSLATVAGVPIGVALSELLDWRLAFLAIAVVTAAVGVAVRLALPPVPPAAASSLGILLDTLRRPGVGGAMIGHVLVVLGHFVAYTYVRLSLERIPDIDAGTIVLLLALFGVGGLIGNIVVGVVVDRAFRRLAVAGPLVIAASIAALVLLPDAVVAVAIAVAVWGFFFSSWLIIVNTWVGHYMPDRLEAGGSLMVSGFQLAIVIAAGVGGILVDAAGVVTVDAIGVALLVVGAVLFGLSVRAPRAGRG